MNILKPKDYVARPNFRSTVAACVYVSPDEKTPAIK